MHLTVLFCTPPPHVTEQSDQSEYVGVYFDDVQWLGGGGLVVLHVVGRLGLST
jgi:hypothetical protein